jgi:RNA-directed DNA polymerase
MERQGEAQPDAVSVARKRARTKPDGEVRARWAWTERSVWTDRMLTALENGVGGGKWFSLIDKVAAPDNLFAAYVTVAEHKGAAGVDHVTTEEFGKGLTDRLSRLEQTLGDGRYRPQDVRRVWIPKPGGAEQRPLGIPTVRDRVVQTALLHVLEPIFEREFAEHSYGFRPNRGCKDALRRVDALLKQGYRYVVDADLRSYFDTIPHERLRERVAERVSDGRVLDLVGLFLEQGVLEGMTRWTPTQGSPQGAVISPLLSNIYLNPLDHEMAGRGYEMVRYADDFVVLCRDEAEAVAAIEQVRVWVVNNGLELHAQKTRIVDAEEADGFEFLGYHFTRGQRWPRKKSMKQLKDTLRDKTRRTSGHSLAAIIVDVNRTLQGWYAYFKHAHRFTFRGVDGWVRMRLRSILRKRAGRRGRGTGLDHQRYRNAYFRNAGLFSLQSAWMFDRQSSMR